MSQRAKRPTDDFLLKIGIFHLQDDTDLRFYDERGRFRMVAYEDGLYPGYESKRSFLISKVDGNGEIVRETAIPAFETENRKVGDIYADLRAALVDSYNAHPLNHGLKDYFADPARPRRPTQEFLASAGITYLPHNTEVTFRNSEIDVARAFIVKRIGADGTPTRKTEIPARETGTYSRDVILDRVGKILAQEFCAIGKHAFGGKIAGGEKDSNTFGGWIASGPRRS